MGDLALRHASVEDAALLAELGAQTFGEAFGSLIPQADVAAYLTEAFTVERLSVDGAGRGRR